MWDTPLPEKYKPAWDDWSVVNSVKQTSAMKNVTPSSCQIRLDSDSQALPYESTTPRASLHSRFSSKKWLLDHRRNENGQQRDQQMSQVQNGTNDRLRRWQIYQLIELARHQPSAMLDSTYSVRGKSVQDAREVASLTLNAGLCCSRVWQHEQSSSKSLKPWTPQAL